MYRRKGVGNDKATIFRRCPVIAYCLDMTHRPVLFRRAAIAHGIVTPYRRVIRGLDSVIRPDDGGWTGRRIKCADEGILTALNLGRLDALVG